MVSNKKAKCFALVSTITQFTTCTVALKGQVRDWEDDQSSTVYMHAMTIVDHSFSSYSKYLPLNVSLSQPKQGQHVQMWGDLLEFLVLALTPCALHEINSLAQFSDMDYLVYTRSMSFPSSYA